MNENYTVPMMNEFKHLIFKCADVQKMLKCPCRKTCPQVGMECMSQFSSLINRST